MEDQEFREFLHEMDPRYIVPGRTAITTELSKAVLKLKRNISKELKSARKINLCCDIWSKKGMTESYLGVTAHFFANHQRCKATLAVRHFESPHTGDRILNIVKVVLNDWDISCSQVGKIVTDNGSNMLKAFKETINCSNDDSMTDTDSDTESDVLVVNLPENEDEETNYNDHDDQPEVNDNIENVIEFDDNEEEHNEIFTREEYQCLSCFSHTLQPIVTKFDDVKPCKEAISICKKLVARFNKSVKATEMLIKLSGKKLIEDCPTRWSSTYLLLKRLLDVHSHVESVVSKLEWDGPQAHHWKAIESIVLLLEPFAEYTALCGDEDYTSISCVIPALIELELHLETMKSKYGLGSIASIMKAELERRYKSFLDPTNSEFQPIYVVATSLDLRYRVALSSDQLKYAKCFLKNKLEPQVQTVQSPTDDDVITVATTSDEPPCKRFRLLSQFLTEKQEEEAPNTNDDIQEYFDSKRQLPEKADPLNFWIENEQIYPRLAPLAQDILVIPASSTPIERVFSKAGYATSGRRNRLSGQNLEREVLLKTNKQYY